MTASAWVTDWQWSWWVTVLVAALGGGYAWAWVRARRRDRHSVSPWWALAFAIVGVGVLAYALSGPVAVWSPRLLWVFALQVAVLTAVVPTGIALGRPLDVLRAGAAAPEQGAGWGRSVLRVVTYPFVSSSIAAASLVVVFFTRYGADALDDGPVRALLTVHLLVVGTLVVLPLLTEDVLPRWATPGVCVLLACVDGLFDAIPGILVMTHHTLLFPTFAGFGASQEVFRAGLSAAMDQKLAGGALLAVAEAVGLPLLAAVFVEWVRADRAGAAQADAELDARYGSGTSEMAPWWTNAGPEAPGRR